MGIEQPGLEKRMGREARRISSQHRQLDELYALVEDALEQGDAADAALRLTRFADALEAHFSLEDNLYFPALHGMRPELGGELEALSREHGEMLVSLAAIRTRLDGGDAGGGVADLEALALRLAGHEAREEDLVARIRGA